MSEDTNFAKDPELDLLYTGFEDEEPAERQEQEDALPRGTYLVELSGGKASFSREADVRLGRPMPGVRMSAKVIEGQEGTVGRVGFGNLKIYPAGDKFQKAVGGQKQPRLARTDEEYAKDVKTHKRVLRRVQTELNLVYGLPGQPHTEATLTEWGAQFAGKQAVLEITQMPGNDEFDASNFFLWATIAAPGTEVLDKKTGAVVGTALDEAKKKITKQNKRVEAKKSMGKTAAQFGGSAPSGF